jgi:hypothetical protein
MNLQNGIGFAHIYAKWLSRLFQSWGVDRCEEMAHFSDLLISQVNIFVETELDEKFGPIVKFVKKYESSDQKVEFSKW